MLNFLLSAMTVQADALNVALGMEPHRQQPNKGEVEALRQQAAARRKQGA